MQQVEISSSSCTLEISKLMYTCSHAETFFGHEDGENAASHTKMNDNSTVLILTEKLSGLNHLWC